MTEDSGSQTQTTEAEEVEFPTKDSGGRVYGEYVQILEERADEGDKIRKDERLVAAIHEAVRLGINPNAGQTPEEALAALKEQYDPESDDKDAEAADLSPVVIPWLDENPVFDKPEEGQKDGGNYQQGHFFGVYWRREMPKDKKPARRGGGGGGGGARVSKEALAKLEARLEKLEARLIKLEGGETEESTNGTDSGEGEVAEAEAEVAEEEAAEEATDEDSEESNTE